MKETPVACALSDAELQQRRAGVLAHVQEQVQEVKRLDSGYAFRFAATNEILDELTTLIQFERSCCQFLAFKLKVLPQQGPIWLELSGPEGTKEFLEGLFDLS